jgi:hypothetical protein
MKIRMQSVSNNLIEESKIAYSCRRVDFTKMHNLVTDKRQPVSGDLVLCKVEQLGRLTKLELRSGRRAHIFPGDQIILCYGDRYAPDYYEAIVPEPMKPCDLAATGGIAGQVIAMHEQVSTPTLLIPQGMLADKDGKVLNVVDFALEPTGPVNNKPLVLMVLGTAMNSGKTTVACSLVRGLVNAGLNTGAAKLTGTGSGPDVWLMKDCGAQPVLDMVDAGLASTYKQPTRRIADAVRLLTDNLAESGVEAIVLEVADGLYHEETQALLGIDAHAHQAGENHLAELTDGVMFAASDALGAAAGVDILRHAGMPILAVAGKLTRSPLAVREAKENIGLPVLSREVLSASDVLPLIRQMLASQSKRKLALLQPVPSASENA